ncbi:MAG: hypothetical protein M3O34_00125 [Chloroflexota bacterium]|nr:hypothetical protein [Chloroflexota bacterium]
MSATVASGGEGVGVPRLLLDLADGLLSDGEADTVVAWLVTLGLETVPPWVVNRDTRIAGQSQAGVVPRPVL